MTMFGVDAQMDAEQDINIMPPATLGSGIKTHQEQTSLGNITQVISITTSVT